MQKHKDKPLNTPLANAFDFTHGDLESNRAGFISYRQKKLLRLKFWFSEKPFGALFLGLFALCAPAMIISAGIAYLGYPPPKSGYMDAFCIVGIQSAVSFGIFAYVLNTYKKLKNELESGKIETFHWSIQDKIIASSEYSVDFRIKINKTYYKVSRKQYDILEMDKHYTFYVTPTSKKILSVEPISPEEIE